MMRTIELFRFESSASFHTEKSHIATHHGKKKANSPKQREKKGERRRVLFFFARRDATREKTRRNVRCESASSLEKAFSFLLLGGRRKK
jgi:hypothetical protein